MNDADNLFQWVLIIFLFQLLQWFFVALLYQRQKSIFVHYRKTLKPGEFQSIWNKTCEEMKINPKD